MYLNNNCYKYILKKYKYKFEPGDIIAGTILSYEANGYLVNIGAKHAAYLPNKEIILSDYQISQTNQLPIYITSEFFILIKNHKSKQFILSIKRLAYIKSWQRIKQLQKENTTIYTYINNINKGGFVVSIENIQGFIPKSHLGYNKLNKNLNQVCIPCKFLSINEYRNQIILSHKCALLEKNISKIKVGNIIEGLIIDIKSYGIFINIYNIPALLHISEINKEKVNNVNQIFNIGNSIKVQVIYINIQQGKLLVSQRHLL